MKQKWMLVALALLALVSCKNAAEGAGIGGTETPPKIPSNVDSLIEKLSGAGPYTLVATGNWSSGDLSTLAEALKKDESKKVNLDLSGVEGLETIGQSAFEGCSSLTSISLPSTVTTIKGSAFANCSSLTSISLPASVTSIGGYAFSGCSLTNITIPASVKTIGIRAFYECSSLTTVTMEATTPPELEFYAFYGTADTLQILVPKGSKNAYESDSHWNSYKRVIIEQTS